MTESKSIFISYARRDAADLAQRLHADLLAAGHDPWLDTAGIEGGASWSVEIEDAIERCEVALTLLSDGSYRSEICRAEHLRALRKGKRVIPILVQKDTERPLYLEHLNFRDFSDRSQYNELLAVVLDDIAAGQSVALPACYQRTAVTNAPPRPPNFLPRPDVLDTLRQFVTNDSSDRRIALTALHGMGGIGKSVIAAVLCHDPLILDAYPDGVIWITIGREPENLTLKLRKLGETLGDDPHHYATQEEAEERLRVLLPTKTALVVLDDVWDADHLKPFIVENTPGSRLLFTTRDAALATATSAITYRLNALSRIEALHLLAQWVNSTPEMLPELAYDVAEECGYLPLALALCGAQVRDGILWSDLLEALRDADLEFLDHPHGSVMKSIKVSLEALERENVIFAGHYRELVVFPEDTAVPEAAVVTLWLHTNGLNERHARRLLTTLESRALVRTTGHAPNRLVELHDLQHRYLKGLLQNIDAVHGELVEAYRRKCPDGWPSGPNDGYFFERLVYHLREAGRRTEAYHLLIGSPAWMEAKFTACKGDAAYVADLTLAIQDLVDPLDAEQLLALVQLHAVHQMVFARLRVYNDNDLRTLTWLGREREALNHARIRTEPYERCAGLMAVYWVLQQQGKADKTLLDEARAAALSVVAEWGRAHTLSDIAVALAQAGHYAEAEEITGWITSDKWSRVYALIALATALAQAGDPHAEATFAEAEELSRDLTEVQDRAAALRLLAVGIGKVDKAQAAALFIEAERIAYDVTSEWDRVAALSELAVALAQAGSSRAENVFIEAETITGSITSDWGRAFALRSLATALAQVNAPDVGRVFAEAQIVTSRIASEWSRADSLAYLTQALAQAGRYEEAEASARSITDEWTRMDALRYQATELARTGQHTRAEAIFVEAGTASFGITLEEWRADALSTLASALAQTKDPCAEAVFTEATAAARNIVSERRRAAALRVLGVALAESGHPQAQTILSEAAEEAYKIPSEWQRTTALNELATELVRIEQYTEAEEVIRHIPYVWSRICAQSALAGTLAQAHNPRAEVLFFEAEEAVHGIVDIRDQAVALRTLGAEWAKVNLAYARNILEKAETITRSIVLEWDRAVALSDLAAALAEIDVSNAEAMFKEAETITHQISSEWGRGFALQGLAIAYARVGYYLKAQTLIQQIGSEWGRSGVLNDLALVLIKAQQYGEAEKIASSIPSLLGRKPVMRLLASAIAQATGQYATPLAMLGPRQLDEFIQILSEWGPAFETMAAGLSSQVLRAVIRIVGWGRSDWDKLYKEVLEPAQK